MVIQINRLNEKRDMYRIYKVILDDQFVGEIKRGESKSFEVSEGEHTLFLKIDWCTSNRITFNTNDHSIIEFDCGNSMKGWRILFPFLYITFLKNKYLWIEFSKNNF